MLSAGEYIRIYSWSLSEEMRKFIAAMATASIRRVGFYRYRTGAQESAGADSVSETSTPPGVPQARRRAPRSGEKRR